MIRGPRSWSWRKTQASITVHGPQFKALGVAGSGVLEASLSNQPSLLVMMAGSGDLRVHSVTAHQIEVNVAGSGDGRIKGAAQIVSVSVAGSGVAWLVERDAEGVRLSVAGSGDARVNARQRLRVSVAGSGDVRWTGPATDVTSKTVGSGSLKRL
ncbi:MAG: GIN domain-containing protein [Limnohabitans sp.]